MRVDSMLQHPGIELQTTLKEKGLTQKAFSLILGKKVSEVNELLKGKRNITIQRDYLLHKTLGTPIKYRILKQIDYEYSLLNIDEEIKNNEQENIQIENYSSENTNNSDFNILNETNGDLIEKETKLSDNNINNNIQEDKNKNNIENTNTEEDEDLKNRIKIFRSF